MSNDRDLTALDTLDPHDKQSRHDWAKVASEALIQTQGDAVCREIAARGLDAFIARSREPYRGHGFKHEDFVYMFERICEVARTTAARKSIGTVSQRMRRRRRTH